MNRPYTIEDILREDDLPPTAPGVRLSWGREGVGHLGPIEHHVIERVTPHWLLRGLFPIRTWYVESESVTRGPFETWRAAIDVLIAAGEIPHRIICSRESYSDEMRNVCGWPIPVVLSD